MAASSLLALIDDIAGVLDDVALLTKLATKKTAGVLGDDLALNAQQVSGVHADRELPVVWAVAKGSFVNKTILVPAALLISALAPWAVTPLLMIGGAFLCYEGFEKIAHRFFGSHVEDDMHRASMVAALSDATLDPVALEKDKIKGAIRTDFILSAEIITIALGTVADAAFTTRVLVLVGIALLMTVGVYGLVAAIVKLDDLGLHLAQRSGTLARSLGRAIVSFAPWLMKFLSIAGTLAMFLVGGGILAHGIAWLYAHIEDFAHRAGALPGIGVLAEAVTPSLLNLAVGVVVGGVVFAVVTLLKRLRPARAAS